MSTELDALATAFYVTIDNDLINHPKWAQRRPTVGIAPKLSDAEMLTLGVLQALPGYTSEARFIRYAHTHLTALFPYIPARPGYNKRLRAAAAMMRHVTAALAQRYPSFGDDVWLVASPPASYNASAHSPQPSGTTKRPTNPDPPEASSPTTTNPWD